MGGLYVKLVCQLKSVVDRRFYAIPQTLKPKKGSKSTDRLKGG